MTNELAVTDLTVPTATLAASEIDLRLDSTVRSA